jgi:hypothetical protein
MRKTALREMEEVGQLCDDEVMTFARVKRAYRNHDLLITVHAESPAGCLSARRMVPSERQEPVHKYR